MDQLQFFLEFWEQPWCPSSSHTGFPGGRNSPAWMRCIPEGWSIWFLSFTLSTENILCLIWQKYSLNNKLTTTHHKYSICYLTQHVWIFSNLKNGWINQTKWRKKIRTVEYFAYNSFVINSTYQIVLVVCLM